jgi:addiction module HigA family antidote
MYNPPHAGQVLREYLGDATVFEAAKRLNISRPILVRILNGEERITEAISAQISAVLGTNPQLWSDLQNNWEESRRNERSSRKAHRG